VLGPHATPGGTPFVGNDIVVSVLFGAMS